VVIAARNAQATLARCLDAATTLDYPTYEVILVDDGSTDATVRIARNYPNIRVIEAPPGGPSRARNIGIGEARGDIVAFTDSDCVPEKAWLAELAKGFTGQEVAGVGGDQGSPADDTPFGREVQGFFKAIGLVTDYIKTAATLTETSHNPSCNSAYRKQILEEVGGFDEALWPGEDLDLDVRIRSRGYRLLYNPAARVAHYRPRSYRGLARMMRRYGACQWPLILRYGFFRRIYCLPVALTAGALLLAGLLLREPRGWPVLLCPFPATFMWFWLKTRDGRRSLLWLSFLVVTLASWHWGLFTAIWDSRNQGSETGPKQCAPGIES
jgi:cellulose synthase/poly-beta-1,6-N-acetylglucosamine synthase-like glycosyltransferase